MVTLQQKSTTLKREILAELTAFASMAYIPVVNPDMLSITGMDHAALLTATALAAAVGTLLMAFTPNYPIAQATDAAATALNACLGGLTTTAYIDQCCRLLSLRAFYLPSDLRNSLGIDSSFASHRGKSHDENPIGSSKRAFVRDRSRTLHRHRYSTAIPNR